MSEQLRVGQEVNGYLGGVFGTYGDRRVEAVGVDWVVLRSNQDGVEFYEGEPEYLLRCVEAEEAEAQRGYGGQS